MKKDNCLQRLQPEYFDVEQLMRWTREGRVFISMPRCDDDSYRQEVLDYVESIRGFATDAWHETIDALWHEIVGSTAISDCLVMKKGSNRGHMNRYTVTNLVMRMQNNGIYTKDVPMLKLHLTMERTTRKNKYYTSCGNYMLSREARAVLRELLNGIK